MRAHQQQYHDLEYPTFDKIRTTHRNIGVGRTHTGTTPVVMVMPISFVIMLFELHDDQHTV